MKKTHGCKCACHRQSKRRNSGSKRYMRGGWGGSTPSLVSYDENKDDNQPHILNKIK